MPRNMSCMYTIKPVKKRQKTETRRLKWWFVKVGDILQLVEKSQGLGKGGKIKKLCLVKVVEVRRERLDKIDQAAVIREGFPHLTPAGFVEMFCGHMKCTRNTIVTVIRWEYLE